MSFWQKILAWFRGAEDDLEQEIHDAVAWLRPRVAAYAKIAEEILAENAQLFFEQAAPVIAQAAAQAIDSGMKGVDVRDFAKQAILPIAQKLAVNAAHEGIDAFLNTTLELNHMNDLAPESAPPQ